MNAGAPIPLVDLRSQYASIKSEIDEAVQRVLNEANFILGPEVEGFERSFADYVGTSGAVGVASGTAALELALRALGIGPGDEVITPAHTFIATAGAVSNVGARPVFADAEPTYLTMDPAHCESLITPRTRAIIPVDLYGHPAHLEELEEIARRHGLFLIEDAAQAHGAELNGRRCGSFGDIACFSFYPGKNLGAYGDAGAVTSNDPALLDRVRRLRDHGRTSKYEHETVGQAERMDALQAAVLSVKLAHLEDWTEARRRHAGEYSKLLDGANVELPAEADDARHVYHLYVIRTDARDGMLEHLHAAGIGAGIHYPIPLHQQPAYARDGYAGTALPVTEEAAPRVLSLPMYAELTDEQIGRIVDAVVAYRA